MAGLRRPTGARAGGVDGSRLPPDGWPAPAGGASKADAWRGDDFHRPHRPPAGGAEASACAGRVAGDGCPPWAGGRPIPPGGMRRPGVRRLRAGST